jgi:hypothetical protein
MLTLAGDELYSKTVWLITVIKGTPQHDILTG